MRSQDRKRPSFEPGDGAGSMLLINVSPEVQKAGDAQKKRLSSEAVTQSVRSLSSSGSNQARKGRLVDALAVRGDEGRDTLR